MLKLFIFSVSSALTSHLPEPFTEEPSAQQKAAKEKAVKARAVSVPAGTTIMRKLKNREQAEQQVRMYILVAIIANMSRCIGTPANFLFSSLFLSVSCKISSAHSHTW